MASRAGRCATCHCAVFAHCFQVQPNLCPQVARGGAMLYVGIAYSADYHVLACHFNQLFVDRNPKTFHTSLLKCLEAVISVGGVSHSPPYLSCSDFELRNRVVHL